MASLLDTFYELTRVNVGGTIQTSNEYCSDLLVITGSRVAWLSQTGGHTVAQYTCEYVPQQAVFCIFTELGGKDFTVMLPSQTADTQNTTRSNPNLAVCILLTPVHLRIHMAQGTSYDIQLPGPVVRIDAFPFGLLLQAAPPGRGANNSAPSPSPFPSLYTLAHPFAPICPMGSSVLASFHVFDPTATRSDATAANRTLPSSSSSSSSSSSAAAVAAAATATTEAAATAAAALDANRDASNHSMLDAPEMMDLTLAVGERVGCVWGSLVVTMREENTEAGAVLHVSLWSLSPAPTPAPREAAGSGVPPSSIGGVGLKLRGKSPLGSPLGSPVTILGNPIMMDLGTSGTMLGSGGSSGSGNSGRLLSSVRGFKSIGADTAPPMHHSPSPGLLGVPPRNPSPLHAAFLAAPRGSLVNGTSSSGAHSTGLLGGRNSPSISPFHPQIHSQNLQDALSSQHSAAQHSQSSYSHQVQQSLGIASAPRPTRGTGISITVPAVARASAGSPHDGKRSPSWSSRGLTSGVGNRSAAEGGSLKGSSAIDQSGGSESPVASPQGAAPPRAWEFGGYIDTLGMELEMGAAMGPGMGQMMGRIMIPNVEGMEYTALQSGSFFTPASDFVMMLLDSVSVAAEGAGAGGGSISSGGGGNGSQVSISGGLEALGGVLLHVLFKGRYTCSRVNMDGYSGGFALSGKCCGGLGPTGVARAVGSAKLIPLPALSLPHAGTGAGAGAGGVLSIAHAWVPLGLSCPSFSGMPITYLQTPKLNPNPNPNHAMSVFLQVGSERIALGAMFVIDDAESALEGPGLGLGLGLGSEGCILQTHGGGRGAQVAAVGATRMSGSSSPLGNARSALLSTVLAIFPDKGAICTEVLVAVLNTLRDGGSWSDAEGHELTGLACAVMILAARMYGPDCAGYYLLSAALALPFPSLPPMPSHIYTQTPSSCPNPNPNRAADLTCAYAKLATLASDVAARTGLPLPTSTFTTTLPLPPTLPPAERRPSVGQAVFDAMHLCWLDLWMRVCRQPALLAPLASLGQTLACLSSASCRCVLSVYINKQSYFIYTYYYIQRDV